MKVFRSLLISFLTSSLTFAQAPAEPLAVGNPPLESTQPPTWSERCLARPTGYYGAGVGYWHHPHVVVVDSLSTGASAPPPSSIHPSTPVGPGTHGSAPVSTGSGASGGSGGDLGVALVVAAVVIAAILPFVIYAIDDEAGPDVLGRYACPSAELDLRGGVESDGLGGWSSPLYVRTRIATHFIGLQAAFDVAPWNVDRSKVAASVALWLRAPPKEHLEIGLTVGYRSLILRESFLPGLEVALPHEYVLSRHGAAQVGLELRPAVFIYNQGADVQLDLAFRIPLGDLFGLTIGGRVFTIDSFNEAGAAAQAGFWARW